MRLKPRAGTVLVRPITTSDRFPGSAIIIPDVALERLTAGQMEIVALGDPLPPLPADDRDPDQEAHQAFVHGLAPGAWVLLKPRSWIEADPGRYLVPWDAILGVFA